MRATRRPAAWTLAALAALGGTAAQAWTPASLRTVAAAAARLAPPDLHRQIARNRDAYMVGVVEPFRDPDPTSRIEYPDGQGRLDEMIERAVRNAILSIRAPRPFNEIAYRLGVVAHYLAQANNPLAAANSDPRQGTYAADFARYVESVRPRMRVVFYGFRPGFDGRRDLPVLVDDALKRSRGYYPLVGREYRRIGFRSGVGGFDDRSTAYALAAVTTSQAVSDIAEVFRYIWLEAGGIDTRRRLPARGRQLVVLPLGPAELDGRPAP